MPICSPRSSMALEKLDSQAVKQRGQVARDPSPQWTLDAGRREATAGVPGESRRRQPAKRSPPRSVIFRVNGVGRRKPMTLDEALLEMDKNRDYLVYRDADRDDERQGLSVLVRRRDGHFDLIES